MISTMSESHLKSCEDFLKHAKEYECLLILIIDQLYKHANKVKDTVEDKASVAKIVYTIVVKAYKEIPAVRVR